MGTLRSEEICKLDFYEKMQTWIKSIFDHSMHKKLRFTEMYAKLFKKWARSAAKNFVNLKRHTENGHLRYLLPPWEKKSTGSASLKNISILDF